MDTILEQFLIEARENLSFLDKHLRDLENGDEEVINALFRAAHTLKGGAGLVGLNAIKEITHVAEDLLDAYRKKEIEFKEEMVDALYDAFDEVVELIDAVEELGSIEVNLDEKKIENIKNEIRSLLKKDNDNKKEVECPFNIDEDLTIAHHFSFVQIEKIASISPLYSPKVDEEFLNNENHYLAEFDLERDVVERGNDPIYLFYLLGTENIKVVSVNVVDCSLENPLEWVSYIVTCIKIDASKIEDIFYNILDEIRFVPLSVEKLFDCNYDEFSDSSIYSEFKNELIKMYKRKDYSLLSEKLSAITQIINEKSKEGFIFNLLLALSDRDDIDEIVKIAINKLGWDKDIENNKENKVNAIKTFDEKEIKNAINILNSQLKVLEFGKDETLLKRTKLLVSNVIRFLNLEDGLENVNSIEELKVFIQNVIDKLTFNKEEKEIKKEKKIAPKQKVDEHQKIEKTHIAKTVKIEQSQIDELMDIVGELLVMKNSLPYIAKQITNEHTKRELLNKYEQISRVTDKLQDRVMGMRLLPLNYIFNRYPKLIRDISKALNKKVKYVEEGGDTKLDKTVIEKLADPMIHVIRNSLDHGIETPEERVRLNKDETGILKITATNEGDKVLISVEDDGKGIDEEKVAMKALEMGIVDPNVVDSMSKEDKLKLIFHPGLSTKNEVTEFSGRGVGTDAIKRVIEELGGNIRVFSEKGKGTKIVFELPLSVALTTVFHVKMNNINYAIPMDYVIETGKIDKSEIKTAYHKPFVRMRGELILLLFEPVLLGREEIDKGEIYFVIVQVQDKKVGLVVDEFVGQLDAVQKPLSGVFKNHPFLSGTSLLGNGDVLFIIDIKKLIR